MKVNRKHVLYVGGFELPDKNAAAHRVLSNAKLLKEFGYEVSFLGIDHRPLEDKGSLYRTGHLRGFLSWSLKYPGRDRDWYGYVVKIAYIRKVIETELNIKPFAIIAYDFPAVALVNLRKYCKANGIILIGDCAEWYSSSGNLLFKLVKSIDTALRMRYIHKRLDGMITISKYLFDYYSKRMHNVLLLPPLVDKSEEKWNGTEYYSDDVCKLVYAGSPGKGKKDRIDKILLCLSEIKNEKGRPFFLKVIGITKEEYLKAFHKRNIPENIQNNIEFKGRITHQAVIDAVKEADYSIFIRQRNRVTKAGFPTKLVESIACGTPVLTNNSSNIKDYFPNEHLGFMLDDSTIKSLSGSLVNAINQPKEKIRDMKNACKEINSFDYHSFITETEMFLRKVSQ